MSRTIAVFMLTTASLAACSASSTPQEDPSDISNQEQGASIKADYAALRAAMSRYQNVKHACADGFALGINNDVKGCIAGPAGGMGYHFSRQDLFDDPAINELEPEVLVYFVGKNGKLELGAVEWVVYKPAWEAVHGVGAPPPNVFGTNLTVINQTLNFYVAHAWVWEENPSGIMSNFNPEVACNRDPRIPAPEVCDQP